MEREERILLISPAKISRAYSIVYQSMVILFVLGAFVFAVTVPSQTQITVSSPTLENVCNWLPPGIEEVAVAKRPPQKTYSMLSYSKSLNLCLLPLMPDALLKELDLITFQEDWFNPNELSGAWTVDLRLDKLPRFSGTHKIEFHSEHRDINAHFYTDHRTLYPMRGKYTDPGRIMFTLPLEVDLWIDFVAEIKPHQLIGTYTRFDRDKSNGHITKTFGTWSAKQQSQEGGWTKDIAFCVKGRGKFIRGKTSIDDIPEECQVVVFRRAVRFDFNKLPGLRYLYANQEIAIRHGDWRDELNYYLAQPKPNVLLIATSKEFMNTTIQRMVAKATDSPVLRLLERRPGSQKCVYQVIRYHRPSEDYSASHRRLREFFDLSLDDDSDLGLFFCQETYSPASIELYYFSKGRKGVEQLAKYFRGMLTRGNCVKVEAVAADCSRITITPSNYEERSAAQYFFQLL